MKSGKMILFCWLGILALAVAVRAQDDPWQLGRKPQRFILKNGLTVVLQNDDAAANSVLQLFIRGGSRDDPAARSGLAYLTMRLALEIPDQTKLRQLVDFGSSFSLHVSKDYSLITIRALSRHMQPTLEILTAIFLEPLFSSLRIDGIKAQMQHLQKRATDEPNDLMRTLAASNFFGEGGYGGKLFGDELSLAAISKKDIQAFFDNHFVAANMVAVIISDLNDVSLKPMLDSFLGRLPAGQEWLSPPLPAGKAARPSMSVSRQSAQTHIACAALLPELSVENLLLAQLLQTWLGKGIGCKLWPLRDQSDLTYGVNADVLPQKEAMLLNIYLKTGYQHSDDAEKSLLHILREVYENGISEAELSASQAYAQADFWRENETRERRAATLAFMEGMGLSYRLAGNFATRLGAVTRDQMNRFIRNWLAPQNWVLLRIGPQ
ncbi:MAG: insulinase family protein [Candidatus Aminicenantes bacterium]|nr:insulinase family protein [Candidatus Aminicenantes bacterium]